jgi:hypothetical protein
MLSSRNWPILFAAIFGVVSSMQLQFQTANQENICFDHDVCPENSFCALRDCIDFLGRNISCGTCKECTSCHCDTDSIDSACPRIRCPDQPSQGVRFLQGVFLGHDRLGNASNYFCTRRLTISGATIAFFQTPVHDGHPASQAVLNISGAALVDCPIVALSGVIIETAATVGSGSAVRLQVAITSDGKLTLR